MKAINILEYTQSPFNMKKNLTLKELAKKLKARKSLKKEEKRSIKGGKTSAPYRIDPVAPILPQ